MTNEILFFIEILVIFSSVTLVSKFLKREGLIAWVAIASILANIITAKNVGLFGFNCAIGNVMFASTFLATDMLTELYGKESAKKAVNIGLLGSIMLIISTQICLHYIPSSIDYANDAMSTLFSMNLRITLSSLVMYYIANIADVYLYSFLKKKTNNKYMWLRNNLSTMICNTTENFLFMIGGFLGIYDFKTVIMMAVATTIFELVAAVFDTPFLYLAKKINTEVSEV